MFALRGSSTTSPATTPLVPAPLTRSGLSTRRPAIEDLFFFGVVLWGCIVLTSVLSSFDILSCPIHGILDSRDVNTDLKFTIGRVGTGMRLNHGGNVKGLS